MTLTLTILGCGSSAGVPRVGNDWGKCDPANPRNRRLRCSVLATRVGHAGAETRVLVDTSPDLRQQMLDAAVPALDAVWFTHEHADHTHGIDDLRPFFIMQRHKIPCWADEATAQMLRLRFAYCFEDQHGYPAIASLHPIHHGRSIEIAGAGGAISATAIPARHGAIDALCFRFGTAAYMPDVNGISEAAMEALAGLDLLIIDALRYTRHPSHFCLEETLAVIERLKPTRAVLTNMHIDLDYDTLAKSLPGHIRPAFDGMKLDVRPAAGG
jgi:phosphoribosyl 1,2-cyclic phosphate phosphodiesterase